MEGVQDGEDHMAEKKLTKISKIVKSSILESFSALESDVESYRVAAGVALLRELSDKQHENEDESLSPEFNYTLTRLLRGLGGAKTSKRAGCFSALVGILSTYSYISVEDLMDRARKDVQASKSVNKSEQTGAYISQLLLCGAIIHSGVFLKVSLAEQQNILTAILSVWKKKKDHLSLVVSSLLRDLLEKIDETYFKDIMWPLLKPEVSKSWQEHTFDSLHLLMVMREKYPDVVKKKFLVEHLNSKKIIHEETLVSCCAVLLNTPMALCQGHPIMEDLCHQVSASNLEIPFWEALVKDFQKRPSSNREEVVVRSLDLLIQNLGDTSKVPVFLNDIFMEQVIKTLKARGAKGDLYQKVRQVFIKMSELMKADDIDDSTRIAFLKRLVLYPGNVIFDKLASTNFVFVLSSQMKIEGIKQMAHIFRDIISAEKPKIKNSTGETCNWNKFERIHVVRMFTRLLSLPVVQQHEKWRVKQTVFLFSVGLFAPGTNKPAEKCLVLSGDSKDAIFKVLDIRAPSLSQLCSYLNTVVGQLHELLFDCENPAKLQQPLTEKSKAAWQKMMDVVKELESSVGDSEKSERQMFLVLFLQMGLQLFQNPSLAEESLEELYSCYERIHKKGIGEKGIKKVSNETENDEEPHWAEVVVDLLLSLLSRNSHLLRNVVTVVFPYLCPHLTQVALFQILEVLNPYGKRPMAYQDGEEGEESDESEEEMESDAEPENTGEKESDLSDDEDLDDLRNEPVNVHLKMAVQKALSQAGGADSDQESVNIDDMTEEEGKRLDEALSNAFKLLRKSQSDTKKKQSRDDETLMNFRVRVMDLLDTIVVTKPELGRILDLTLPLFSLLEFCVKDSHQAPLERRVRQCLKKLCAVKQFSNTEGVDQALLVEVLQHLLQKGERAATVLQSMGEPLVQCSTFVARTANILAQQEGKVSSSVPVQNVFMEALNSFFKKRDSLLPLDVFKSVLHLPWDGAWKIAPVIMDFAFDSEIRPFRRHQALQLLIAFYSNDRLLLHISEGNKKTLQKLEKTLSQNVLEIFLSEAQRKTASYKDKYMQELLALLTAVYQAHKRHSNKELASVIDWEAVKKAVCQYGESFEMSRVVKPAFKKLARSLQISVQIINKKQNGKTTLDKGSDEEEEAGSEDGGEEEKEKNMNVVEEGMKVVENGVSESENYQKALEKKVKKRKRQKFNARNRADLKKQSREARLTAMSEGLDTFDFSVVNVSNLQELDIVDENKGVKRKEKPEEVAVEEGYDNLDVEGRVMMNAKKFRSEFRGFKIGKKKLKG